MEEKDKKKPEETNVPENKPEDEKKPEDKPGEDQPADKPEEKDSEESAKDDNSESKPEDKPNVPEIKTAEPAPAADPKDEEILRLKTQIAAMQLGVKPDCMEDVVAIAESYVTSGKAQDIDSALSAVVKKYPDMKSDGKADGKKGGFKVGAGDGDKNSTDNDKLSKAFGLKKKGKV